MILTAHQPAYLPWLGLFHKIALADQFVSFDMVQYLPKDWNNRNRLKSASGPIWLTVPVLRKGYLEKPISDIEIRNDLPWARKHWNALYLNYGKAPYFDRYAPFFEDVYHREWRLLADLDTYMLRWFLETLGIDVIVSKASEHHFAGQKSDLVLDMCQKLGADLYVFGALGKDYARTATFEEQGVRVMFQEYKHPAYRQLHGSFLPCLSVVDLLFNCGEHSLDVLMSGNLSRQDAESISSVPISMREGETAL